MLTDYLESELERENVNLVEFKELLIRLLNYGVLSRNESQIEQQLYDRYVRIKATIEEYLRLMDVRVLHEPRFETLRLYPPGSLVPGMEDAEEASFTGGLRSRLSQHEVALILVLRVQYDKALREGKVDESGYVTESLEALNIAIKNLLGRSVPEKLTERKRLFQRLRQLRLIEYRLDEEFDTGEAWLKIHPMIVSFVSDECLAAMGTSDERGGESRDEEAFTANEDIDPVQTSA